MVKERPVNTLCMIQLLKWTKSKLEFDDIHLVEKIRDNTQPNILFKDALDYIIKYFVDKDNLFETKIMQNENVLVSVGSIKINLGHRWILDDLIHRLRSIQESLESIHVKH